MQMRMKFQVTAEGMKHDSNYRDLPRFGGKESTAPMNNWDMETYGILNEISLDSHHKFS